MTRMEQLYSMRMKELVVIAEGLGIKVNKKGKNSVAAEKIYAEEQRRGLETYKEQKNDDPMAEHIEEVTVEKVTAEKKEKKTRGGFSEEFAAKLAAYVNTLEGVTCGAWKNTANLFWIKFTRQTAKGKAKQSILVEIRIGSKQYGIKSAENEKIKASAKVTGYYLHNNYGKFDFTDNFYQEVIAAFM